MSEGEAAPGAGRALAVLSFLNLFHFLDRYIVTAVLPRIQKDLDLSDAQSGMLGTAFIVVFMLTAPVFGRLGDRLSRTRLIAAGVAVWSAATAAAGLARSYEMLLATRAVVGIGEAAYATISPTLIADLYPPSQRGRAMSAFFACMPVGAALGFLLGGFVGSRWGWRDVFYIAGLPGLVLASLTALIREPGRGRFDAPPERPATLDVAATARVLLANRRYVMLVLGYTAYVFAVGGLAFWMPTFLHRVRGMDLEVANRWFGAVTVLGGLCGALGGGAIADRLLRVTGRAHGIVAASSTILAAPFLLGAIALEDRVQMFASLLVAEVLLFASMPSVNAAIVACVSSEIRASAVAASILVQHLLGDAISPWVIGTVSDAVRASQERAGVAVEAARAGGLLAGTLVVPAFVLLGGLLWASTARPAREYAAGVA